jgi:hypothetical protein
MTAPRAVTGRRTFVARPPEDRVPRRMPGNDALAPGPPLALV